VKVLHTIPQMGVGGAERVVIELVAGLGRRGHSVSLVAADGPLDDDPALRDVRRVRLLERGRSLRGLADTTARMAREINRWRPDLVHAHGVRTATSAATAMRVATRRPIPLVVTFHGVVPGEFPISARILRNVDALVAISEEMSRTLMKCGFDASRLSVIPNGVTTAPQPRRSRPADPDALTIAAVGRLVPEKAYDRLISAARIVVDARPRCRFLIVGDGPLRGDLERLTQELGLTSSVRFLGLRRDARDLIGEADVVAFSSDSEGLSIAALEAMAAGVPVVSTPAPGMSDLLATGAGIVTRDYEPQELAQNLIRVLDDPGLGKSMGSVGRQLVSSLYSVDAMVASYLELYASLSRSSE
jgi:glycosyltransferase involved in cell wall biosynthesis